eukprot:scaffold27520_cov52-Phaeocystis_antarctica.AAC.3
MCCERPIACRCIRGGRTAFSEGGTRQLGRHPVLRTSAPDCVLGKFKMRTHLQELPDLVVGIRCAAVRHGCVSVRSATRTRPLRPAWSTASLRL